MRSKIVAFYAIGAVFMIQAVNVLLNIPGNGEFLLAYCLCVFWLGSALTTILLLEKLKKIGGV